MTFPSGLKEIEAVYGRIPVGNSLAVKLWAEEHLAFFDLPYALSNAYVPGLDRTIRRLYCHKLVGPLFVEAFRTIYDRGLEDAARFYGGCWNVRPIRGRPDRWSTHSWGIALDLNPTTNKLGTEGDMHPGVVQVFEEVGFRWGGRFKRKDPMHVQACSGY